MNDLRDDTQWSELHAWTLKHLEDFIRVFKERVRALPIPDDAPDGYVERNDA